MDGTTSIGGVDVDVGAGSVSGTAHDASIKTAESTAIDTKMINSSSRFSRLCLVISSVSLLLQVSCSALSLRIVYQKGP